MNSAGTGRSISTIRVIFTRPTCQLSISFASPWSGVDPVDCSANADPAIAVALVATAAWSRVLLRMRSLLSRSRGGSRSKCFAMIWRSGRNVGQSEYIPVHSLAGGKMQRRPGAREEWIAGPEHHGVEVDVILIDE